MNRPKVKIGGTEYELVLTTAATKEINDKFGGLSKLGDSISGSEGIEAACWLVALLANQGIRRRNLFSQTKEPELTAEAVEILTTPAELPDLTMACVDAIKMDSQRLVESEEEFGSKN